MTGLRRGDSLTLMRAAGWRFAIPMARVDRILSAAMPMAVPSSNAQEEGLLLRLRLGSEVLPFVYAPVLFGEREAVLHAEDKLVVVEAKAGRCVLAVDSVEDMVPYVPLPEGEDSALQSEWVCAVSAGEVTLPVLDVDRLVESAHQS